MQRARSASAVLLTLSLLSAAMPAASEGPDPTSDPAPAPTRPDAQDRAQERGAKRLELWDADGDGKLDDQELAAERDARKKSIEAGNERRAEAAKKRQARLGKYDRDGDGRLSDEERAAMRADRKAQPGAHQKAPAADPNAKDDDSR